MTKIFLVAAVIALALLACDSVSVLPGATSSARAVPTNTAAPTRAPPSTRIPTRAPPLTRIPTRAPPLTQTRPRATMPAQFQEDTLYEGKKLYNCDAHGCWRADGTGDTSSEYFYPDLNANNDEIRALLTNIGLPGNPTTDDRENGGASKSRGSG